MNYLFTFRTDTIKKPNQHPNKFYMQNTISKIAISFLLMILPAISFAQFSFTNSNDRLISTAYHSGCSVTVADWNHDGLDDIIKLNQGHDVWIEIQQSNGKFLPLHIGDFGGGTGWSWGMAAGDFDHNGYLDVVAGNGSVKVFMTDASGAMGAAISLPLTSIFLQNVTLGDFNNDGWLDIYGCHDVGESKIWLNDGAGNFPAMVEFTGSISGNTLTVISVANGIIPLGFYLSGTGVASNTKITAYGTGTGGVGTYILSNSTTVASTTLNANIFNVNVSATDDSGNYGTTWSDYDNDGDLDFYVSKCRQPVNQASDMRRHDVLHINDGTYHFDADYDDINTTDQDSLLIDFICPDQGAQTWTTNFGDFDNDGDFDLCRTSYTQGSELWENDGTGHFTNITASAGFDIGNPFEIESQIEDFDNDGFQDILTSGDEDIMFHNNGNMTFTKFENLIFPNNIGSFGTGDLNHDGAIDVYASYGQVYTTPTSIDDVVYLNNNNTNHWITFNLVGTVSNHDAIGAKIAIYTALGTQIREARAGESYGTENTFNLHFGLGVNTTIDSAIIRYPSGITNKLFNLTADQFVTNVETGGCTILSGNITYSGSPVLCTGQTLTLTGPAGFSSYLWSDGSTNQSVVITALGDYSVLVSNGSCSAYTPSIHITVDPDNTPSISVDGLTTFCSGGSVDITSTSANTYTWSNGATTQTIQATQSGDYYVMVDGACHPWSSDTVTVTLNVLSPETPVGTDAYIPSGTTATLNASGSDIHWFDSATGGTEVGTGNTFTTPVLNVTTVYHAENVLNSGGGTGAVGDIYHTGTQLYSAGNTTNASMDFDADSNIILSTVKVITDAAATRRFVLWDNSGNIVDSLSVYIPVDSTVVALNFNVPAGTGYSLMTDPAVNNANLGYNAPRFQRSNIQGAGSYPYVLPGFVTLTGNNQGNAYYYYFYDMHFAKPLYTCISNRVPVTAFITDGVSGINANYSVSVFPNPSEGVFNIQTNFNYTKVEVLDILGRKISITNAHINELNLSNFSKGTYMLELTDANNITVRRQLIVQ